LIKTAVILAGGKGERMLPITELQPKALVPINGTPILKLQITQLINLGVTEIYVLTGYLGYQIQEYLNTLNLSAKVICINTNPNLKPGERLVNSFNKIKGDFILLYCDNFILDDLVVEKQLKSSTGVTLLLQKREIGNISIRDKLNAIYWGKERKSENPYVELGYIAVRSANFINYLTKTIDINLALEKFSKSNEVYFHELFGTYYSLSNFKNYIDQNLHGKIIILDRDGIINVKMEPRKYLTSMNHFVYHENNLDIISSLGQNNYNFIIATNQPGVATGVVSESFLTELHQKITNDLRRRKINILTFYICKHHWDDSCECRKPKPGMLNQAIKEFKLNRKNLCFIGDEDKDMIASAAAGIKGIKFLPSDHKLNLSLANKLID
jgi:D-glycero-D-manno-heptose 1,7-bisphosphate phosphatase